jgi:hydrogenase maturation factor
MNLVTGRILEIYLENGIAKAKVSVDGAIMRVPLMLVMDSRVGDEILIESGVAISRLEQCPRKEPEHVSGNPR